MKKSICLILSVLFVFSLCLSVSAEETAILSGAETVALGEKAELVLSFAENTPVSSASVEITCTDGLTFVSASFLKSSSVSHFNAETKKGALIVSDLKGDLLRIVVKGGSVSKAEEISVKVKAKNGNEDVVDLTVTATIQVLCKEHSFGKIQKLDKSVHAYTCSVCGHTQKYDHTWDGGVKVQEATCSVPGSITYKCTACGETKGEAIPVNTNHQFGNWETEVPATCTTEGVDVKKCAHCSYKETKVVPKATHTLLANGKIIREATCTTQGSVRGTCAICKMSVTDVIPAKGHTFIEYSIIKAPTCLEEGLKEGTCKYCEETVQVVVPATGHGYDSGVVLKESTATEPGVLKRTCTLCKATTEEAIPPFAGGKEEGESDKENTEDKKDTEESEESIDFTLITIIAASGLGVLILLVVLIAVIAKAKKKQKKNEETSGAE